jgi:hypothetical protein
MGKYRMYERETRIKRPWDVHPVWRGIGCLMMLLIPVIAYAGADLLVDANSQARWIPVSRDLMKTVSVPVLGLQVQNLYANLLLAAVLSLIGFGLLTAFFSVFSSLISPPRLGPFDAPPERRRPRRR